MVSLFDRQIVLIHADFSLLQEINFVPQFLDGLNVRIFSLDRQHEALVESFRLALHALVFSDLICPLALLFKLGEIATDLGHLCIMVVDLLKDGAGLHNFVEFGLDLRQLLLNDALVSLSVLFLDLRESGLALECLNFIFLPHYSLFVLQRFGLQLRNLFFAFKQLGLDGRDLLCQLILVLEDFLELGPECFDALAFFGREFLVEPLDLLVLFVCTKEVSPFEKKKQF